MDYSGSGQDVRAFAAQLRCVPFLCGAELVVIPRLGAVPAAAQGTVAETHVAWKNMIGNRHAAQPDAEPALPKGACG